MTRKELVPVTDEGLVDLAQRIGQAHCQAQEAAASAVLHAIEAGKLLEEVKTKLAHGQWLPWLKANVPFTVRTAQNYMKLAQNAKHVSHLSVRDALQLISSQENHHQRVFPHYHMARELFSSWREIMESLLNEKDSPKPIFVARLLEILSLEEKAEDLARPDLQKARQELESPNLALAQYLFLHDAAEATACLFGEWKVLREWFCGKLISLVS